MITLATILLMAPPPGAALVAPVADQEPQTTEAAVPPRIYLQDTASITGALVTALKRARRDQQRILFVWGRDSAEIARGFHDEAGRGKVWRRLSDDYRVVWLDPTTPSAQKLRKSLGGQIASGPVTQLPWVQVISSDRKLVTEVAAADWFDGEGWDGKAVLAFLDEQRVAKRNAREILDAAIAQAKKENKRLFVHIGAPW
jgi:hypothetical protein